MAMEHWMAVFGPRMVAEVVEQFAEKLTDIRAFVDESIGIAEEQGATFPGQDREEMVDTFTEACAVKVRQESPARRTIRLTATKNLLDLMKCPENIIYLIGVFIFPADIL